MPTEALGKDVMTLAPNLANTVIYSSYFFRKQRDQLDHDFMLDYAAWLMQSLGYASFKQYVFIQ